MDVIMNTKNLSGVDRGYVAFLIYRVHWLYICTDTSQNQNQEAVGVLLRHLQHDCNHLMPHKHL